MLEICPELRENPDSVVQESCQCKKWSPTDSGVKFYDSFFLSKEEKLNNYFLECPSQHRTKMFDQSQNRLHNCYILGLCNNCGNV